MKYIILCIFLMGCNSKTQLDDISYPSVLKYVDYKSCRFTIEYSSNKPSSKDFGQYKTKALPLLGIGKVSTNDCKCIEDALSFRAKNIQQFDYVTDPFFIVQEKNNQFEIMIEVKDYIGTKILNFNSIIKANKSHLCKKWRY